jgi:hypothetical protein
MIYPAVGTRVAACRPTPPAPPLSREQARTYGLQFAALLQREIDAAARECPALPEPKQLLADLARGRAASVVTYGAALASLAATPGLSDRRLSRIYVRVLAWVASIRPTTPVCLGDAWEAETLAQASADVHQARAMQAIEKRDVVALDRAIAETSGHITAQQQLLTALERARRQVATLPSPVRRVVFTRAMAGTAAVPGAT